MVRLFFREVIRFLSAAMVLHRRYRGIGFGARVHLLVRFLTCPFLRVLDFVPADARLLEVGGGHGLFATLAAAAGARSFVVDPDVRKVFGTSSLSTPGRGAALANSVDGVRFIAGFDESIRGTFDVVALLDVFYAIPVAEWDALLARLSDRLRPGGLLLVKEMDPRSWKQRWNRFQEKLSMRFLKITYAVTFNYEAPDAFEARLRRHGFDSVVRVRVDAGYPHPHLLFVARKGPGRSGSGVTS